MSRHLIPGRLTGVRQEIKFLLPPEQGKRALSELPKFIDKKIVNNESHSWRISVYLDTPDLEMGKTGLKKGSQTTKLRLKEYYLYQDGSLQFDNNCFLEVKTRVGTMVEKSRLMVNREHLPHVLSNGPTGNTPSDRVAADTFNSIRKDRPLQPLFVAHYRRHTFQDKDAKLRITLDDCTSFHLPPKHIFTSHVPICARQYLPPPLAVEDKWIMEIKSVGLPPEWISVFVNHSDKQEYSKFIAGLHAIKQYGLFSKALTQTGE